jgi:hypothetical protein
MVGNGVRRQISRGTWKTRRSGSEIPNRCTRRLLPGRRGLSASQAGWRPQLHFRGLRWLHSRYGPQGCSATRSGPGHKAPALPITGPSRLLATRLTDNYLDGTFTRQ